MAKKRTRFLDAEQNTQIAPQETQAGSRESSLVTDIDPRSVQLSQPFVGHWETLVSTTNWEKGRIIGEWRTSLQQSGARLVDYNDETWSRLVGGVTPQHVGRLRRVFERFSASYQSFPRLYWSHFLAAFDWDDAEMWLEGASQSRWSVSQMRRTRWETMGADPQSEPNSQDLTSANEDEDYSPVGDRIDDVDARRGPHDIAAGPRPDGPDFGEEMPPVSTSANDFKDGETMPWEEQTSDPVEPPFAKLPNLPADLTEAFEQFKLAIIRHRTDGWAEISRQDVLQTLEALKCFAMQ